MRNTSLYPEQQARWPRTGRHILAQFDDQSIVVYQAYRPDIGHFAAKSGFLGGEFRYQRMSWIKPNFLWMMYRSGWGTKPNQEVTLALRLRRSFFDELLAGAVESSFDAARYPDEEAWRAAVQSSQVRLQWDPDHDPKGGALARRAVQLGLRGETLRRFGGEELLEVSDISDFVATQRTLVVGNRLDELRTPTERVYRPTAPEICARIRLEPSP